MAKIEKHDRPGGAVYSFRYQDSGRTRRSPYYATRGEALRAQKTLRDQHARARLLGPERAAARPVDLEVVAQGYLDQHKTRGTLAARTLANARMRLQRWLDWGAGEGLLTSADLSVDMLDRYDMHLVEQGLSPGTRANHVSDIRGAWAWADERAEARGWVVTRAPHRYRMPTAAPRRVVALSWAELDAGIAAAWDLHRRTVTTTGRTGRRATDGTTQHQAALLMTALRLTGLHPADLAGWTWDRVDLTRARATILLPKTGHDLLIPLHPELVELLAGLGRREGYVLPMAPSERRDNGPRDLATRAREAWAHTLSEEWRGLRVETERVTGQTFKAARRRWRSHLEAEGVPGVVIDHLLGHGLQRVQRAHYTDVEALWPAMVEAVGLVPGIGKVRALTQREG